MSTLVESLRRLYVAGKVATVKMDELLAAGKISQDEYDYIIGA